GAVDYLPKNFEDISRNPDKVKQLLCEKVHTVSRSNRRYSTFCSSSVATPSTSPRGTASALPARGAVEAGSA
ncbi:chemotaxis response regulator protein-glutamate methylesterase, partial [Stutzerimonas stutzeri]|nr:chemotaxis response regulator protein-glutamate methylesterase [Stutzerimonas stutzeri]